MAGPGYGHMMGAWDLRGHGAHDFGGDAILFSADDEGRDADLPEERGRVRALTWRRGRPPHRQGSSRRSWLPCSLHKLLVILQGVGGGRRAIWSFTGSRSLWAR